MTAAKRQPTVETTVIVEHLIIDNFTEFSPGDTTGCGTDQSAENGASHSARCNGNGATDEAHDSTGLRASEGALRALGGATEGPDERAEFPGEIFGYYRGGLAVWALGGGHERFLCRVD